MSRLSLYPISSQQTLPIAFHRPALGRRELESVLDCLVREQISQGEITLRLEQSFASSFGYQNVLAVNSLAAAYHLCFLTLNMQKKDHLILSSLAPIAAHDAASYLSVTIHLVDVDKNSFHPSLESILNTASTIREKFGKDSVIFYAAEHSFGSSIPFSFQALNEDGMIVLEDFTGLIGSEKDEGYFGKDTPLSLCGISEYDLMTTGNGALIVASDSRLHKELHSLRYGSKRKPHSVAYDYRMEDFQSAMGLEQLSQLGILINRRKKIGKKYLESLQSTSHETYFQDPKSDSYLKFPIAFQKPFKEVKRYFDSLRIGTSKITEIPLHHLQGLAPLDFPNAERLYQKSFCLPVYPGLTAKNVERVSTSLRGII